MKKYTPCGGCGATEPDQRCIGCMHPFTEEEEKEQVKKGIAIIGHGSSNEEDDQLKFSIERGDLWKHRAISAELELEELKKQPGARWVKAKERLPEHQKNVIVRGCLNEQGYSDYPFVAYGHKAGGPDRPQMYFEYGSKSFLTNDVEWYDESAAGREDDKAHFDNWHRWLSDNGYTYDGEYYYDEDNNYFTPDQLWVKFK